MKESKIIYFWDKRGWYQLYRKCSFFMSIYPEKEIKKKWFTWRTDGWATINPGYTWDGASSVPDFDWIGRGSLAHDLAYQNIRGGNIPQSSRKQADKTLKRHCIEDGAWHWQATIVYNTVRKLAKFASDKKNRKKKRTFPKKKKEIK